MDGVFNNGYFFYNDGDFMFISYDNDDEGLYLTLFDKDKDDEG